MTFIMQSGASVVPRFAPPMREERALARRPLLSMQTARSGLGRALLLSRSTRGSCPNVICLSPFPCLHQAIKA